MRLPSPPTAPLGLVKAALWAWQSSIVSRLQTEVAGRRRQRPTQIRRVGAERDGAWTHVIHTFFPPSFRRDGAGVSVKRRCEPRATQKLAPVIIGSKTWMQTQSSEFIGRHQNPAPVGKPAWNPRRTG